VRTEQLGDRREALAALQLDAPARSYPRDVLLAVDGDHVRCAPVLGEERVEAVERPDVEHPLAGEGPGQERDPVAVIARDARRVETVLAVEGERVKPERDARQHLSCRRRIGLDGKEIRDGPLGVRDDRERASASARHGIPLLSGVPEV
jgi:hypothetical protein